MGTQPLPKNGAEPTFPNFRPNFYCGQIAGCTKMPLGMEVCLSQGTLCPMGTPHPKGAEPPPQFSAHFYCGQTAGCIKMPLGTDVDLSRGGFVLDGDPLPLPTTEGNAD